MHAHDNERGNGPVDVSWGVLVLGGIIALGTVVLIVATVAAAVGLGIGLVVMPPLMALLWVVRRTRRRLGRDAGPAVGARHHTRPVGSGPRLSENGPAPRPAY